MAWAGAPGATIGFIGLGEMGLPMSANLVRRGWRVVGYDVSPEALRQAEANGVAAAASCRAVAEACDGVVVSIVRTLPQTEAVLFGPDGLAAAGRNALTVIVMSTLDPGAMVRLAEAARGHGMRLVDAPVSGGQIGAEQGTLAIMLAGERQVVEPLLGMLGCFGTNIFHVGERPGMGQAAKLANQIMLSAALAGVAEGLTLAAHFGLTADDVLPIVKHGTGNSWAAEHWAFCRRWWEEYHPGTTLDILDKDLRSVQSCAAAAGLDLPVSARLLERLHDLWHRPPTP